MEDRNAEERKAPRLSSASILLALRCVSTSVAAMATQRNALCSGDQVPIIVTPPTNFVGTYV